jgi:hypothetical protein
VATPDVRVRLSAEGAKEVVDLFRKVAREAQRSARSAAGTFDGVGRSVSRLRGLLGTLGLGITVAGLVGMAKAALDSAEEMGKFADAIGATAEGVSTLKQVAVDSNVEFDTLKTSLTQFVDNLGNLDQGVKEQVKAFRALGLSAQDFVGKDTIQAFDLVAQRLGNMEAGTRRTQLAMDIFGRKTGPQMIPVLQSLAEQGFAAATERARELGVLIDGDLSAAAEAANDSFDLVKAQAQGVANAFVAGLGPSIVQVMAGVSSSIDGDGVKQMKEFGEETGRILRTVIATFKLFFAVLTGIFGGLGDQIGSLFAAASAAMRGQWAEARAIWKAMDEEGDRRMDALRLRVSDALEGVVTAATTKPPPLPPRPKKDRDPAPPPDTADPEKGARARAAAERKAERDKAALDGLLDDERKAREDASEIAAQTSVELLELAGRERDAKIAALDEEITRRKLVLAIAGQLGDREKAQLDRFRELSTARIDFEDLQAQGEAALNALDRERTRIEQAVELGITSQLSGQAELIRVEKERVVVLRQLADALTTAAAATGDPALIAQASQFAQAITSIEVSIHNAVDEFAKMKTAAAEALYGGMVDFIDTMVSGADSVKGAFKSLADSVISAMRRMAAEALATQIFGLLSGVKGLGFLDKVLKKADGGLIRGPGSDRSDNIPALLSPGEYVVRAASVRRIGVDVLDQINRGMRVRMPSYGIPRFAEGGLVGARSAVAASGDGVTIVNNVDARGSSLSRAEFDAALNRSSEVTIAKVRDLVHQGRL